MENTIENAMSFLLNAKNASQYEEANDEVTDRWSVFTSIMHRYASSVRPEVVVPSEEWINGFKEEGRVASNMTISKLKSINPTLTFTELNHEK